MDLELRGKRALVTGSSKGIGFGVAETLAAEGVDLVLAARTEVTLQAAADQIREAHDVTVTVVPGDLSQSADQVRLTEIAMSGPLDRRGAGSRDRPDRPPTSVTSLTIFV